MEEQIYVPEFDSLKFGVRKLGKPHEPNEIVGLHVERGTDGYATKVFQSDGRVYLMPEDLRAFLTTEDPRVFFVRDRDLEPVLKYLGEEACRQLLLGFGVLYDGVQLFYHSSLQIRVAGGRTLKKVYSLKPFFWPTMLPDDMDCYSVQAHGERIVKLLVGWGIPLRLNSTGSLLGELYSRAVPYEAAKMAYNCYHGGWIEMFKVGYFEEAFDYDLASAYPTEAARLVDLDGMWVRSRDWVQAAEYGFCYARIRMSIDLPFSPLIFRRKSVMRGGVPYRVILNPVGVWDGYIVKDEIEFVVSSGIGEVEIIDGWWFVPRDRVWFPFRAQMENLKKLKEDSKKRGDEVAATLVKLQAAALQGKFMQSNLVRGEWTTGAAFCPVYASTITARVRCKVAEVALQNSDSIIGTVVDGLLSTRRLSVHQGWKLEYAGRCVAANHGDYWIEGRETKRNLLRDLTDYRWSTKYPLRSERFISLAEAIRVDGFEAAGRVAPEAWQRVSKIGKRWWERTPKVCEDLLTNVYTSGAPFPCGVLGLD